MVKFRRVKIPGGCYFFTVTLRDRQSSVLTQYIDELRFAMKAVQTQLPFKTEAIVILPDHIHAIWQLPENDHNYSKRWQRIKALFTNALVQSGVPLEKDGSGEYALWQRRFWEHLIRDEDDYENHVNYIHYNPVKHKLVNNPSDWPYSSLAKYIHQGLLPEGWAEEPTEPINNEYGE